VISFLKLRRTQILLPVFLLLVLAAGLAAKAPISKSIQKTGDKAARPNIVFILTDDQDALLGSLDALPAVRNQIAAQGLTFSNAFVPLSLCCPSRSTILTGQYAHNHQVYTNVPPDGGFNRFLDLGREKATIGTAMKKAGYRTALMGKYLNEYPRGAEKSHAQPERPLRQPRQQGGGLPDRCPDRARPPLHPRFGGAGDPVLPLCRALRAAPSGHARAAACPALSGRQSPAHRLVQRG
jgi:hypothetical protein